MLAEDFTINHQRQNRLEIVKIVVENFVMKRKSDRIGIVAFAGRAYTVCPLTLDYDWLVRNLDRVKIGTIEDGTAVGSAIIASLNRLRDTEAKSKIIVRLFFLTQQFVSNVFRVEIIRPINIMSGINGAFSSFKELYAIFLFQRY